VDTNKVSLRELTAFVDSVTVPRGKFYLKTGYSEVNIRMFSEARSR
jgi:hypothetical protein